MNQKHLFTRIIYSKKIVSVKIMYFVWFEDRSMIFHFILIQK